MSKLVKLNGKAIPSDVLDWILDCFWTGTESNDDFSSLFQRGYRNKVVELQWKTICSLSRTSRLLRALSLPRMTGTLFFMYYKQIAKFWRAVQLNPSLGSSTHTCYFELSCRVYPYPHIPSQGLEKAFKEGAADLALREAKEQDPDDTIAIEEIEKWKEMGPDGARNTHVGRIASPEELREALIGIVRSWTRIRRLCWTTQALPFFTEIIEHIEGLGTLDSLTISVAACEERYYLSKSGSDTDVDRICTPLWKLSQQVSHLTVPLFGYCIGGWRTSSCLAESVIGPQLDALTEALQKARNLETLSISGFHYPSKDHNQERSQRFFREVLPALIRIPKIDFPYKLNGIHKVHYAMKELHPQVEALSNRKQILEASDIQELGRKASEEKDHPLAPYSHLLQEEEVAENVVREWNEKYACKLQEKKKMLN